MTDTATGCPKCGESDLEIVAVSYVIASVRFSIAEPDHPDGGEVFDITAEDRSDDSINWNDSSPTRCPACAHVGILSEFRITPQEDV